MSNKSYGLNYERKEKKYWESLGYNCIRSHGSFGSDIIGFNSRQWLRVSVKSTRREYFSFAQEIRAFIGLETPINTESVFVLYQKGKRKVLYDNLSSTFR